MISNKTLATLFLITLNMQRAASTTPNNTPRPSPSDKPAHLVRKPRPVHKSRDMLFDTTSTVNPVEIQDGNTGEISTSQELSVPQINSQFKKLIEKGEYEKIFELGEKMNDEEFLIQICLVVKTLEQYNAIFSYLKRRKLVASFYVYGDIEVVKRAIIAESSVYDDRDYAHGGDLETALSLVLNENNHDRVVEFLSIRNGIVTKRDKQHKQEGERTSFEKFVSWFLFYLTPWRNGMALKRFLTLRGDELRSKHPDILDTLCQELVDNLRGRSGDPKAKKLLIDLIGQPLLLTPGAFARGYLAGCPFDHTLSEFINYGWGDAIGEGLKMESLSKHKLLWWRMKRVCRFPLYGASPSTPAALDAVINHFQTKQHLEEQWTKDNTPGFLEKLANFLIENNILPIALVTIIVKYADPKPTWIDV